MYVRIGMPNDFPSAAAASGAGPREPLAFHRIPRAGLARRLPKAVFQYSPFTAAVTRAAGCGKGVLGGHSPHAISYENHVRSATDAMQAGIARIETASPRPMRPCLTKPSPIPTQMIAIAG